MTKVQEHRLCIFLVVVSLLPTCFCYLARDDSCNQDARAAVMIFPDVQRESFGLLENLRQGNVAAVASKFTPGAQFVLPGLQAPLTLEGNGSLVTSFLSPLASPGSDFVSDEQTFRIHNPRLVTYVDRFGITSGGNSANFLFYSAWRKLDTIWRMAFGAFSLASNATVPLNRTPAFSFRTPGGDPISNSTELDNIVSSKEAVGAATEDLIAALGPTPRRQSLDALINGFFTPGALLVLPGSEGPILITPEDPRVVAFYRALTTRNQDVHPVIVSHVDLAREVALSVLRVPEIAGIGNVYATVTWELVARSTWSVSTVFVTPLAP